MIKKIEIEYSNQIKGVFDRFELDEDEFPLWFFLQKKEFKDNTVEIEKHCKEKIIPTKEGVKRIPVHRVDIY